MSYNINSNNKTLNGNMILLILISIMVLIIIFLAMNNSSDNIQLKNKEVTAIINATKTEYAKSTDINNILISIGLKSFNSIEYDETLNDFEGINTKGYRIKTNYESSIILYLDSNNKVICVRWADKDYYRDGNVLKKFN